VLKREYKLGVFLSTKLLIIIKYGHLILYFVFVLHLFVNLTLLIFLHDTFRELVNPDWFAIQIKIMYVLY